MPKISPGALVIRAIAIALTYPAALAVHGVADLMFGDDVLVRDLQYGSRREVVNDVAAAWGPALASGAVLWLLLAALRRTLGSAYAFIVAAVAVATSPVTTSCISTGRRRPHATLPSHGSSATRWAFAHAGSGLG